MDIAFRAVGVVCHEHQELITEDGFVKSFRLTRNPVDKDGKTAAIVEEGRIHLEISLVFAVESEHWRSDPQAWRGNIGEVAALLSGMRIAGGTLIPPADPWRRRYQPYALALTGADEDRQAEFRRARMRLLPGFSLVARDDLLDIRLTELQAENPQASRLDAWLSLARINWRYRSANEGRSEKSNWTNDREGLGWIVPIPVGYGALGQWHPPGSVANARDATTPFRFVESLYSVGQWISPHRLHAPDQLLWYADSQPDKGLYRCRNDYRPAPSTGFYDFE